jgi:hypothetical protein
MSKRHLHLVEGTPAPAEGRIYRLRESSARHAPAEKPWPASGEWRELVRRLQRNPVKPRQ